MILNAATGVISGAPTIASSQATYMITATNPYSTVDTLIQITVKNPAVLSIPSAGFADTLSGQTSAPVQFTVTNTGENDAIISAVGLIFGDHFAITGGTCAPLLTLAQGASCSVIAVFNPTTIGVKADSLSVLYKRRENGERNDCICRHFT